MAVDTQGIISIMPNVPGQVEQARVRHSSFRVDAKKLEQGCRMIDADCPSFLRLGLEDGHVPSFWPLLGINLHKIPGQTQAQLILKDSPAPPNRAPKDHIHVRPLQNIVSGITSCIGS